MDDPLETERDFLVYLALGYLVGCTRCWVLQSTNEVMHREWSLSQHALPDDILGEIVSKSHFICNNALSQQEWLETQMNQKADRLAAFLTGKADPHHMPGFIQPWIRYSLKEGHPPLFLLETLMEKALDLIAVIQGPLFSNPADFSTYDRLQFRIVTLINTTPWVPRPIHEESDERAGWVSLARFAEGHPVWSNKVIALPTLKISRREVSVICDHVCPSDSDGA